MAQQKLPQLVTPKGELLYPRIRQTETFQGQDTGKYTITMKFSKEDTDKFIERLEAEWNKASKSPELHGKTFKRGTLPNLSYREDKNGDIIFKAKTSATIKTKTNEIIERTVPVYDAKGKPIEDDIGHGSIGRVSVNLAPYYVSSSNYGIVMYLNGIQVVDYKAPGSYASASALGFVEEEGYTVQDPVADLGFNATDEEAEF